MSLSILRRTGGRQLGLVTVSQAKHQLRPGELRTALRRGWLEWVQPRVLAFAGSEPTWRRAALAAVLSVDPTGAAAAASHTTAAGLWGVPGFEDPAVEILVRRHRRPRLGEVRVHTTLALPRHHVTRRGVVPVTTIERTMCDLGGVLGAALLGQVVDDMIQRRAVSLPTLRAVHGALHRGGRPVTAMAAVLAARGERWDRAQSPAEPRIAEWIVAGGLPPPVAQFAVGGYVVDWAYPEERVFIEYDGFHAHATRTAFDGDRRRANALVLAAGATVLRFTSASTREEVVRDVAAALERATVRAS
jgi:hypothetical protein